MSAVLDRVGQSFEAGVSRWLILLVGREDRVDQAVGCLTWDAVGWRAVDLESGRELRVEEGWVDRGLSDGTWTRLL